MSIRPDGVEDIVGCGYVDILLIFGWMSDTYHGFALDLIAEMPSEARRSDLDDCMNWWLAIWILHVCIALFGVGDIGLGSGSVSTLSHEAMIGN